jgi:hypothetical protein
MEGDAVTMSPSSAATSASPGKSPRPRRYVPFSAPAEGDAVTMSPSSATASASPWKSPRPWRCVPFSAPAEGDAVTMSASSAAASASLEKSPLRRGDGRGHGDNVRFAAAMDGPATRAPAGADGGVLGPGDRHPRKLSKSWADRRRIWLEQRILGARLCRRLLERRVPYSVESGEAVSLRRTCACMLPR